MNKRTVVEKLPDGHLVVTQEVLRTNDRGGTSHDRKLAKKRPPKSEWRKAKRTIFRAGVTTEVVEFGPGIEILPFGEYADLGRENEQFTRVYTGFARETIEESERQRDAFAHDPTFCKIRKVKKVILLNEDGTVEEL